MYLISNHSHTFLLHMIANKTLGGQEGISIV